MLIASNTIPDIQKALDLGKNVPAGKRGKCTASLSALLYLALTSHASRTNNDAKSASFLEALGVQKLPALVDLLAANGVQRADNPFGTYPFEAFRIGSKQDLLSEDWTHFCDRFRRAASRGKQSSAVLAVASVFREMADNVTWHAYESPDRPCRALAGYHVSDSGMCFSVADDGQGFLKSLQRNPIWSSLSSDSQALDAVVSKQATSRAEEATGGGFKQLFNGLLNLNGMVILRSGRTTFTLRNHAAGWQRVEADSHPIIGSQVTLAIGRNGEAVEEKT